MANANLTAQRLRDVLRYTPDTGDFERLVNTGSRCRIGVPFKGTLAPRGAYLISVDNRRYYAHRLAWLYVYGEWPSGQIDHIDGDARNNRISNLRDVTDGQNKQNFRNPRVNSKSGFLGVFKHPSIGRDRWRARIQVNGKGVHLGMFDTPEEAHAAYISAKRRLHPFGTL